MLDRKRCHLADLAAVRMHRGHTRTRKAPGLPAIPAPSLFAFYPFSFRGTLAEHLGEKGARVHTVCGVVGAGINTTGLFQVRAQIARSRFLLDDSFFEPGSFRIVDHHFERMQMDIAVGAILRAKAAPDAPILDDDFERIASSNRADGTADHAQRVAALAATGGHEVLIETQAVGDETSDAVVRVSASVHASVAACTILQIQNQQALRFHQSLREELIDRHIVNHLHALLIRGAPFGGNRFEPSSNAGKTRNHVAEIVAGDSNELDVIERSATGGSHAAAQQADLAEVIATGKIGQDKFSAGIVLRHLYKTDSN